MLVDFRLGFCNSEKKQENLTVKIKTLMMRERPNYHTYLLLNNVEIGYQPLNIDINVHNKPEVGGDTRSHLTFKNMYDINNDINNYSSSAQQLKISNIIEIQINVYTQWLQSSDTYSLWYTCVSTSTTYKTFHIISKSTLTIRTGNDIIT